MLEISLKHVYSQITLICMQVVSFPLSLGDGYFKKGTGKGGGGDA